MHNGFISYLVMMTYFVIGYFKGNYEPEPIPSNWWSALGVIAALTIAILLMNFLRESEYKAFYDRIKEYQSEIEKTKKLSVLSTILLDITSDEKTTDDNKLLNNYINIRDLFKSGFIDPNDLIRISTKAIRQDNILFGLKIRKMIYETDKKCLDGRLYYLSIISYINPYADFTKKLDNLSKRLLDNKTLFLRELGFKKESELPIKYSNSIFENRFINSSNSNECFAYAIAGRYLFRNSEFQESKYFFQNAIEKSKKDNRFLKWHNRYMILIYFATQNFKELEASLETLNKQKEWRKDFKYFAFHQLMENILRVMNNNKIMPLNSLTYLKAIEIKDFDKFSMWNFTSIIQNLNISKKKINIILNLYHNFYLFFGQDDNDFEEKYIYDEIAICDLKEKIINDLIKNN